MSKNPTLPNPLTDPAAYLELAKPNMVRGEARSKSDSFNGEVSRLGDQRKADLQHQANLAEWDATVKPALKKVAELFNHHTRLVFIETPLQRLGSFFQGKFYAIGRLGVNEDGEFMVANDREEVEIVKDAKTAMALLLGYLEPEIRYVQRQKAFETERTAQQDAQDAANREMKRRLKAGESVAV
jgi:hypothetical protein